MQFVKLTGARLLWAPFFLFLSACVSDVPGVLAPDMVRHNGKIVTVDPGSARLDGRWPAHVLLAPPPAFRVLVEAAHPGLADAVTLHPVCQKELYDPGRNVSINPNENSILTP